MTHWPKRLTRGDRVRIIAPSGAFDRDRFDAGIAILHGYGLLPVVDDTLFARAGYFAGDDAHRARIIHDALRDPHVRAVWAARGGYGATRVLPQITDAEIAARDTWLIGFSDITALHARWNRLGRVSMHAANITTLSTWSEDARDELFDWLMADTKDATAGMVLTSAWQGQVLVQGTTDAVVTGPLLGGNLTVLASMVGTGWLPSLAGAILFLEDIGEKPYRLDRSIIQLVQSGALNGVRGVVIGQLTDCREAVAPSVTSAQSQQTNSPSQPVQSCAPAWGSMVDALQYGLGAAVPIVAGFPFGHDASSRALPLGAHVRLDVASGQLSLAEPGDEENINVTTSRGVRV